MINYYDNSNFNISLCLNDGTNIVIPNSWYITPNNYLYNSMGDDGHKTSNLIYQYKGVKPHKVIDIIKGEYEEVLLPSNIKLLNELNEFINKDCLDKFDIKSYLNISNLSNDVLNLIKIKELIIGIKYAEVSFYKFFIKLYSFNDTYLENLKYLDNFTLDEILIRCIGFHKISSVIDKTITTSCINYEDEFSEYIKNGWRIDFVEPIIFDDNTKLLKNIDSNSLFLRRFL